MKEMVLEKESPTKGPQSSGSIITQNPQDINAIEWENDEQVDEREETPSNKRITSCQDLFNRGFKLVPCNENKVAIMKEWQKHPISSENEMAGFPLAKAWGVACGVHSGVTVVDIDPEGMETLAGWEADHGPFTTLQTKTPRGGYHLYFRYVPEIMTRIGIIPGVDIKNRGGYVIAPPSAGYTYLDPSAEIEEMSGWLIERLRENNYFRSSDQCERPEAAITINDETSSYGAKALLEETQRVANASEGTRNDTLNRAAYALYQLVAGGEITENEATDGLITAAQSCGLKDDEIKRTLESARKAGFENPRKKKNAIAFNEDISLCKQHLTELGNAQRFAEYSNGIIRYVYNFKQWATWTGKQWELDEAGSACEMIKSMVSEFHRQIAAIPAEEGNKEKRKRLSNWAFRSETRSVIVNTAALAQPTLKIDEAAFDAKPFLLNFLNGTLDIRSFRFYNHHREDYLTQIISYEYNKEAKAPRWEQFLSEIFLGRQDLIRFIQKAIGYSLTGSFQERCIFILHGSGKNGKSTFLNVLAKVLGPYAGTLNAEALMIQAHTDDRYLNFAPLRAARFVSGSESEQNKRLAEAKIKQLSGGDGLQARFLHKNFFTFTPQFKIWLSTNYRPNIRGTDPAIWDRIRLIPFDYRPDEDKTDKQLYEKLLLEGEGILAWAVEGCWLWNNEGLETPYEVKRATTEYKSECDLIGQYLSERTEKTAYKERFVTRKALYDDYKLYSESNNEVVLSPKSFVKELQNRGFSSESKNKQSQRVWEGIKMSPQEE